jgi:tetratricopeptide (TPR) repeat protein
MSERRDPTLGALPEIEDVARRRGAPPQNRPSRTKRIGIIAAIVVVPVLAFVLYEGRDVLGSHLAPPSQQNQVMQQADAALRAGRLTSPDGRGARELYEAVLARDPDSLAAHEGLVRTGAAAIAQANSALRANRPQDAQRMLDLARVLSAPAADLQRVDDALRARAAGDAQLEALLAQADTAEQGGHFDDGPRSALALYQKALDAAPDNAVVHARRQALLAKLLDGVDPLLAKNDLVGAGKRIDRVAAVDPGNLNLPEARARLAAAAQRRQKSEARALDAADAALRAGRIDVAIEGYRKVQAVNPNDARARAGLRQASDALIRQANRAIADFDFATAEASLAQARTLAPESPQYKAAVSRLQQVRSRRTQLDHVVRDPSRIDDLLAAADHAIVRDELVDPPGDSAFDKLREAAAIAPGDPRVIAATRRFAATAVACFQREMTDNRLVRAESCLDALIATDPAYARLPTMRQNLAARWLAVADERLGAGELDVAQRAIASARRWAPNDPGIPPLLARLQQARAGGRR